MRTRTTIAGLAGMTTKLPGRQGGKSEFLRQEMERLLASGKTVYYAQVSGDTIWKRHGRLTSITPVSPKHVKRGWFHV